METQKHGKFSTKNLDGYVKKNRFYLKDGSNIFRLLPPFGSMAQSGAIAKYWAVYWLAGTKGKRPVPTIRQVGRDKKVITPDPIYDKVEALTNSLKAQKASGANPTVIEALEKTVQGLSLDKAYYVNVISPAGEIGVLKLRYTAFQALKEKLRQVEKDGIDAVNVGTGVYFDFKKTKDDNNKTVYTVDLHQKTFKNSNNKLQVEIVEAVIDDTVLARMEKEAFDLGSMYKFLNPQEQALAASFDPAVIDRLFARPETADEEELIDSELEEDDTLTVGAPAAKQTTVAEYTAKTNGNGTATVTDVKTAPQDSGIKAGATLGTKEEAPAAAVATGTNVNDMVAQFLATGKIG